VPDDDLVEGGGARRVPVDPDAHDAAGIVEAQERDPSAVHEAAVTAAAHGERVRADLADGGPRYVDPTVQRAERQQTRELDCEPVVVEVQALGHALIVGDGERRGNTGNTPSMRKLPRALAAGAAGTALMTVSTAVEMRLRHRPASTAPIKAFERATGLQLSSDRVRRALSWTGHVPSGVAVGAVRPLLGARPVGSPAAFFAAAWLPDLALVPAFGDTPPPWRWGVGEVAISALHHLAYAAAAETAWRASGPSGTPRTNA